MKLYVEGGGDSNSLKTACREGFAKFLQKSGLQGRMPRIVACGSRRDAYDSFCTAVANGEAAFLLVDSEAPVLAHHQQGGMENWSPWQHLADREGDRWQKPAGAENSQCHLMVQCMESWFLADHQALGSFFAQGFKTNQLPATANSIEIIDKQTLYRALAQATKSCKTKAAYGKGEHSFKLLALIDPGKVTRASGWAKRFVDAMSANPV